MEYLFKDIELVPSHNDCHLHNVLVREEEVILLDYEFFAYSYRGYDLGNFFNECATNYITFEINEELELEGSLKKELVKTYYDIICEEEYDLEEALVEVTKGRMLSHLFWFFIGVKQIRDPKISLDMKYYVKRRYEEFFKLLKQL